jgi:hypothetical protein
MIAPSVKPMPIGALITPWRVLVTSLKSAEAGVRAVMSPRRWT